MGRKKYCCFYLRSEEKQTEAGTISSYERRLRARKHKNESVAVNPEKVNKDVWGQIFSFLTVETAYRLTLFVAKKPDLWYLQAGYTSPSQVRSIQSMWEWVYLSKFPSHQPSSWEMTGSPLLERRLHPAISKHTSKLLLTSDKEQVVVVSEGPIGDYSRIHWRNACRVAARGENHTASIRVRPYNAREVQRHRARSLPLVPCVEFSRKGSQYEVCILDVTEVEEGLQLLPEVPEEDCTIPSPEVSHDYFHRARQRESFFFDHSFWSVTEDQWQWSTSRPRLMQFPVSFSSQQDVYGKVGRPALDALLHGYGGCLMCYGETGAGKTFTMFGNEQEPGLVFRFGIELFERVGKINKDSLFPLFTIKVNFFEIYNEKVRDLLDKRGSLAARALRQHPLNGIFVDGLVEKRVSDVDDLRWFTQKGVDERTKDYKMGHVSSRSHALLSITLETLSSTGSSTRSVLDFVDPAGSEKIRYAGETTLVEARNIGLSLSTLRRVIDKLVESQQKTSAKMKHKILPPYRDSVLTYYLSNHLGWSNFHLIGCISPCPGNLNTFGTLRYAELFRGIRTDPRRGPTSQISKSSLQNTLLKAGEERILYLKQLQELPPSSETRKDRLVKLLQVKETDIKVYETLLTELKEDDS